MDKSDFQNIANDPNFISGIYNYCDRWCERCRFTSKCSVFYTSEKSTAKKNLIFDPEGFFNELNSIFETTMELLQEKIDEIYPEGIPEDLIREEEEKKNSIDEKLKGSVIVADAKKYSAIVSSWFDANKNVIPKYLKSNKHGKDKNITEPKSLMPEAVEVILFYQYFIEVKLMRALRDNLELEVDSSFLEEDLLTSAKLVLLAITRSLASWEILHENFSYPDEILDILIHLEKLRRQIEKVFPDAWLFKRPYFD
jgi:hypothetical protein